MVQLLRQVIGRLRLRGIQRKNVWRRPAENGGDRAVFMAENRGQQRLKSLPISFFVGEAAKKAAVWRPSSTNAAVVVAPRCADGTGRAALRKRATGAIRVGRGCPT